MMTHLIKALLKVSLLAPSHFLPSRVFGSTSTGCVYSRTAKSYYIRASCPSLQPTPEIFFPSPSASHYSHAPCPGSFTPEFAPFTTGKTWSACPHLVHDFSLLLPGLHRATSAPVARTTRRATHTSWSPASHHIHTSKSRRHSSRRRIYLARASQLSLLPSLTRVQSVGHRIWF